MNYAAAMSECRGSASPHQIDALQTRLGISLPPDYRAFLLQTNGGRHVNGEFDVEGWGSSVVCGFNGVETGDIDDIAESLDRIDHYLPTGLLPIGYDPGGNFIVIGVAGGNAGQIFFVDHEEVVQYRIGTDFLSFFTGLR